MWRVKYGDLVEVRAGGDGLESVGRVDSHDFVGEASPQAADVEYFGIAKLVFFRIRGSGGDLTLWDGRKFDVKCGEAV